MENVDALILKPESMIKVEKISTLLSGIIIDMGIEEFDIIYNNSLRSVDLIIKSYCVDAAEKYVIDSVKTVLSSVDEVDVRLEGEAIIFTLRICDAFMEV